MGGCAFDKPENIHRLTYSIVGGDDDQIVPIAASALLSSRLVKNATLKAYPGADHGLAFTHQEQFNKDLLSFLKS